MAKKHQFLLLENLSDGEIVIALNNLIVQGYTIIAWQIVKYVHSERHDVFVEVE